jgi:hypothetical protein
MHRVHYEDAAEMGKSPDSDLEAGRAEAAPMNPDPVLPHVAVFA